MKYLIYYLNDLRDNIRIKEKQFSSDKAYKSVFLDIEMLLNNLETKIDLIDSADMIRNIGEK